MATWRSGGVSKKRDKGGASRVGFGGGSGLAGREGRVEGLQPKGDDMRGKPNE